MNCLIKNLKDFKRIIPDNKSMVADIIKKLKN